VDILASLPDTVHETRTDKFEGRKKGFGSWGRKEGGQ